MKTNLTSQNEMCFTLFPKKDCRLPNGEMDERESNLCFAMKKCAQRKAGVCVRIIRGIPITGFLHGYCTCSTDWLASTAIIVNTPVDGRQLLYTKIGPV